MGSKKDMEDPKDSSLNSRKLCSPVTTNICNNTNLNGDDQTVKDTVEAGAKTFGENHSKGPDERLAYHNKFYLPTKPPPLKVSSNFDINYPQKTKNQTNIPKDINTHKTTTDKTTNNKTPPTAQKNTKPNQNNAEPAPYCYPILCH